jgi:hypothetical protein
LANRNKTVEHHYYEHVTRLQVDGFKKQLGIDELTIKG